MFQCAPYGGEQIDARTLRFRPLTSRCRHDARATYSALLLQFNRAIGADFGKNIALNTLGVGCGAPLDIFQRLRHSRMALGHLLIPVGGGNRVRHQLVAQLRERIARCFRRNFTPILIGLRILSRMSGKAGHDEPDQSRAITGSHAGHGVLDQGGSGLRIRSITIDDAQPAKALQIPRNVAPGSLMFGGDRNPVAVVFNKEQEWQSFGGDDIQSCPKPIGRRRRVSTMRHGNTVFAGMFAKLRGAIAKRLSPSHRRRVLRAHATANRQDARTYFARHVKYHADIATVAHAAGSHHG